jgi:hypothetical protein
MSAKRNIKKTDSKAEKSRSKGKRAKKTAAKKGGAAPRQLPAEAPAAGEDTKIAAAARAPAQPRNDEEMRALIETIDAPSLHDEDIAATLKHLNSVVTFRRAVGRSGTTSKKALSGKCYLKAAGDPIVSIYEGPYHVDSMSEDSAIALGIPRCGA